MQSSSMHSLWQTERKTTEWHVSPAGKVKQGEIGSALQYKTVRQQRGSECPDSTQTHSHRIDNAVPGHRQFNVQKMCILELGWGHIFGSDQADSHRCIFVQHYANLKGNRELSKTQWHHCRAPLETTPLWLPSARVRLPLVHLTDPKINRCSFA